MFIGASGKRTAGKCDVCGHHGSDCTCPAVRVHYQGTKVFVTKAGVAAFNQSWPCSPLRDSRAYWFDFGANGDLVDTDVPESDDGEAAAAMADDCKEFLFDGTSPAWAK